MENNRGLAEECCPKCKQARPQIGIIDTQTADQVSYIRISMSDIFVSAPRACTTLLVISEKFFCLVNQLFPESVIKSIRMVLANRDKNSNHTNTWSKEFPITSE